MIKSGKEKDNIYRLDSNKSICHIRGNNFAKTNQKRPQTKGQGYILTTGQFVYSPHSNFITQASKNNLNSRI
jgi:hypothetical protein